MSYSEITPGNNIPAEVNVIIEVAAGSTPVKYEMDKETGKLLVDRIIQMPMFYPCNYGYINKTVSGDGDPVDVLVITEYPLIPGCIIKARPIGVLMMEDESGVDEKILTVPTKKISPLYEHINSYKDLPAIVPLQISSFFEHYKKLEKNKWVKLLGWEDADKAHQLILQAIKNYQDVKDL